MATITRIAPDTVFDFDFYRFNGKGGKPNLVPTVEQPKIMRPMAFWRAVGPRKEPRRLLTFP